MVNLKDLNDNQLANLLKIQEFVRDLILQSPFDDNLFQQRCNEITLILDEMLARVGK